MPLIKIEMESGTRAKKRSLNRKLNFHGFYTSRALDNENLMKKKREKKKRQGEMNRTKIRVKDELVRYLVRTRKESKSLMETRT